jgi:hypothetical protein
MIYLMVGCLSRSQEKASPRKMGLLPNGGVWKVWKFELFENWSVLNPQFFVKSCLFLKTEMDKSPSNFTGNTMQCISIDWYPEIIICMLYGAVNATRSVQKSDQLEWNKKWQVIQGDQTFLVSVDRSKALLSLCQIWRWNVHPVHKKKSSKKMRLFPRSIFSSN